jgi:hypothetical protein
MEELSENALDPRSALKYRPLSDQLYSDSDIYVMPGPERKSTRLQFLIRGSSFLFSKIAGS